MAQLRQQGALDQNNPLLALKSLVFAWRFGAIFALAAVLLVAVIARLAWVQFVMGPELRIKALRHHGQTLSLISRGSIVDRRGVVLAQDMVRYDVFAHPKFYWGMTPEQIARGLAPILKQPAETLAITLAKPYTTIRVASDLSRSSIQAIQQARITVPVLNPKTQQPVLDDQGQVVTKSVRLPGLDVAKKTLRAYPQGPLAAHLLGYVNDNAKIYAGLEKSAAKHLQQHAHRWPLQLLDGRGQFLNVEALTPERLAKNPKASDLPLTLDAHLQHIAEIELAKGMAKNKGERGAVIMLTPQTGEVLAFAVWPSYDPNQFPKYSYTVLKNWALTDVYPPGSTTKILTVANGLETGVINENSRIHDTGQMRVGGWLIQNYDYYKRPNPGMIDLVWLFQHSSNIASAKIAMAMDKPQYYALMDKFGFGRRSGIELSGESAGWITPHQQWDISTQASMGYGYGIAATPLQMAGAVAAIANNGVWMQPHLIQKPLREVESRRVLSPQTAATVTRLLTKSIGTAATSSVRLENGISVAGKTGTSKKPNPNGPGYTNDRYTSFVGFFPASQPKVLMMVVVDSPHMAEAWGSTVAGPIFKNIGDATVRHLGIQEPRATVTTAPH